MTEGLSYIQKTYNIYKVYSQDITRSSTLFISRVSEYLKHGYTLREIAEKLGYSYSYLRVKIYRYRKRGFDFPTRMGRRKSKQLSLRSDRAENVITLNNCREENEQLSCRLTTTTLLPHVIAIVLDEGAVSQGEIYRRLKFWGFKFSRTTLYRAVRLLELYGYLIVERRRGPRGNFIKPSPRLHLLIKHVSGGGDNIFRSAGEFVSYASYVENRFRSWEYGFEFRGVRPSHVRWMQSYCRDGKWRVEFHPFKNREPDWFAFLGDLLRLVCVLSVVLGLSYVDLLRVLSVEYATCRLP